MTIETKFDIDQEVTGDGEHVDNNEIGKIFSIHARVGCRGEGIVIEYAVEWECGMHAARYDENDLRDVTNSHPVKMRARLVEIEGEIEDLRDDWKWVNNPSFYLGNLEYERETLTNKLEAA